MREARRETTPSNKSRGVYSKHKPHVAAGNGNGMHYMCTIAKAIALTGLLWFRASYSTGQK